MKDKITLGKFIQSKRRECGLSQRELAEKLYVTESAVSKWERGVSYPDITMISGICETLKISEHELCIAGEDTNQRRIELMARKYTRFKWTYNIILGLCYLAAIIPCFIVFVIMEHSFSQFFILLTSLMLTASLLNVPTLTETHRGLITLGSFWLSLNLLMLSGCVYSGGDWFIMAFICVLMGFSIVFLPFVVRSELIAPYLGSNKALVCMAVDTLLIMAAVIYGTLRYGTLYDLRSGGISAVWCLVMVWVIFVVFRYAGFNVLFRTAVSLAAVAAFIFLTNPVLRFAIDGENMYFDGLDSANMIAAAIAGVAALFAAAGGVFIYLRRKD